MKFMERIWQKISRRIEREEEADKARLAAVQYGEKSLLVTTGEGEELQMVDIGKGYLFVNVENENYLTDFDSIPDEVIRRRSSFIINKADITSVDVGADYPDEPGGIIGFAEMKLRWSVKVRGGKGCKTQRKSLYLLLSDDIAEDRLRAFLAGAGRLLLTSTEDFGKGDSSPFSSEEQNTRRGLLAALTAITLTSVGCVAGLRLSRHDGLTKCFMATGALLPFVLFGLYFCFQRNLVIRRSRQDRTDSMTVDMDLPLCVSSVASLLLMYAGHLRVYNLPLDHATRWGLTALALFGVLMILLCVLPSQVKRSAWRDSLYTAALYVVYAAIASISAVYLLNYALDFTPPRVYEATIQSKFAENEHEYRRQATYTLVTVRSPDVTDCFDVTADVFERTEIGTPVTVTQHAGALGLPYNRVVGSW